MSSSVTSPSIQQPSQGPISRAVVSKRRKSDELVAHAKTVSELLNAGLSSSNNDKLQSSIKALAACSATSKKNAVIKKAFYDAQLYLSRVIKDPTKKEELLLLLPLFRVSAKKISKLQQAQPEAMEKALRPVMRTITKEMLAKRIPLLEKALNREQAQNLSEEEKQQVEELLEFALGNKELNILLHHKKHLSKAENFLHNLSYETLLLKGAPIGEINEKAQRVLEDLHLHHLVSLNEACSSLEKQALEQAQSLSQRSCPTLNEFLQKLTLNDHTPYGEQRFSEGRLFLLEKIRQELSNLKEISSLSEGEKEVLRQLSPLIEELYEKSTAARETITTCSSLVSQPGFIPQLTPFDAKTLYRASEVSELMKEIAFSPRKEGRLGQLLQTCSSSKAIISDLTELSHILPGYRAGDIMFDDERLVNDYEGRNEPPILRLTRHSFFPLLRRIHKYGFWDVESFITGIRTHASICEVREGKPYTMEISDKFLFKETSPYEELIRVTYRPNFSSLMTPQAIQECQSKGISLSDVERIYAEKLALFLPDSNRSFHKIHNDILRGMLAFLIEKLGKKLPLSEKTISTIVSTIIPMPSATANARNRFRQIVTNKDIQEAEYMICSEFVVNILRDAQKATEDELKRRLGNQDVPIFYRVFQTDIPSKAIHPARLEEILTNRGYYTRIGPSLFTRLLFTTRHKEIEQEDRRAQKKQTP